METEPPSSRPSAVRDSRSARPAEGPIVRLRLELAVRSECGEVRSHNEDIGFVAEGRGVFGVCDGMGGARGGEVASAEAARLISTDLDSPRTGLSSSQGVLDVARAIKRASAEVHRLGNCTRGLSGMGTTATVAVPCAGGVVLGHVGDSRAYLLRRFELKQLTRDQTLVQQMIDLGRMTPEEAESCNLRHVVLQAVGASAEVEPDVRHVPLEDGDVLLICSDGLSGTLSDGDIRRVLLERTSPRGTCDALVAAALEAGAQDNVTCVVARVTLFVRPR